jgi:hypothetical protein
MTADVVYIAVAALLIGTGLVLQYREHQETRRLIRRLHEWMLSDDLERRQAAARVYASMPPRLQRKVRKS